MVPRVVVVVPHRNREASLDWYERHMLQDVFRAEAAAGAYRFLFVEQGADDRFFNRGGMKNIGFLVVKAEYPEHYKQITLTFNDIDTMPRATGLMDYETEAGVVKHFYGVKWALGGIISIRGEDFESLNGFPNYWSWGYEDNMLKRRVSAAGLEIDYRQFYKMNDADHVIHHSNNVLKVVNVEEHKRYLANEPEGVAQISELAYETRPRAGGAGGDDDPARRHVYVSHFQTPFTHRVDQSSVYDVTKSISPFTSTPTGDVVPHRAQKRTARGRRRPAAMQMVFH